MDTDLTKCIKDSPIKERRVIDNAVDFAISTGIVMLKKDEELEKVAHHIPFTLFPTSIPANTLSFLKEIQPHYQRLLFLAGQDKNFMKESLQGVLETDEFTKNLYDIYEKVQMNDSVELGIFRSDYMLNCKEINGVASYTPKQIEINTMAVSFIGCGTQKAVELYRKTLQDCGLNEYIGQLHDNNAADEVAKGFVSAWEKYDNPEAVILFLIGNKEQNIFDQREIEYRIKSLNSDILVRRKFFDGLEKDMELSNENDLFIDGKEVALVYFRCAYMPDQYTTKENWRVRLDIERSRAIKSPSVATQLAGCKKIQQVLAEQGKVERFIKDGDIATKLRSTFAGLYTLEQNKAGDEAVKMGLEKPGEFVLKPQREGGGNNLYEDEMVTELKNTQNSLERMQYILMERIFPNTTRNLVVSQGKATQADVVSELGVYGVFVSKGTELVENYTAGHLLRSKPKHFNDGGVAAGAAVLDTPLLV